MAETVETKTEAKSEATPEVKKGPKRKDRKNVAVAVAHIQATFNNTLITLTEPNGNVLCWSSAGEQRFKGSKKSTPFAAEVAASAAGRKASEFGVKAVDVVVRGPGAGREAAIRALQGAGLKILSIKDATPIPHNGCRPKKRRRV